MYEWEMAIKWRWWWYGSLVAIPWAIDMRRGLYMSWERKKKKKCCCGSKVACAIMWGVGQKGVQLLLYLYLKTFSRNLRSLTESEMLATKFRVQYVRRVSEQSNKNLGKIWHSVLLLLASDGQTVNHMWIKPYLKPFSWKGAKVLSLSVKGLLLCEVQIW